jgi:hypothetical protein
MIKPLLPVAIVLLAAPLAPISAQPSDRVPIDMSRLYCGVDTAEVYVVQQGTRKRTGTVIEQCRSIDTGSARRLMRIARTVDATLGTYVDTTVDMWNTLEPRSYRGGGTRAGTRLKFQLEWTGDRLRGRVEADGMAPMTIDQRQPSPVYNGTSMDLVLRAAPLKSGYSIVVPAFVPGRGATTFTAVVADEEFVAGQLTWRVDADFAGRDFSVWIIKSSRRIIKQTVRWAPGAEIEFVTPSLGRR